MTRNGFQLLVPLLVVMLSITVVNTTLKLTTGMILPHLISEAFRPLIIASRYANGNTHLIDYM